MLDRSHSADRLDSDAGATRTAAAGAPEQHAQVAALDGAPPAAEFGNAAGAVGLDGNGNDTLIWRDVDALLAGGAGTDTLSIAGGDLDLGTLTGIASGIERLDLATDAAANNATLTATDVLSLSDTDVLTIAGTAADSVDAGTGWIDGGFDGAGNHVFTKLVGPSLATLVVNQDVTVNADITA